MLQKTVSLLQLEDKPKPERQPEGVPRPGSATAPPAAADNGPLPAPNATAMPIDPRQPQPPKTTVIGALQPAENHCTLHATAEGMHVSVLSRAVQSPDVACESLGCARAAGDPRQLQTRLLGRYGGAAAAGQAPFSHSTASAFTPQQPTFGTFYNAPPPQLAGVAAAGYRPPDPRMMGPPAAAPAHGDVASSGAAPVRQVDLFSILQNAGVRPAALPAQAPAPHYRQPAAQQPYIPSLAGEDLLAGMPAGNGAAYAGSGAYTGYRDGEHGAGGRMMGEHAWQPAMARQEVPAAPMQPQLQQPDQGAAGDTGANIGAQLMQLLGKFGS